ncbi:uncharacterized protein BO80DRAFT_318000, partial [Aspergillus ibericus CBS 121593]
LVLRDESPWDALTPIFTCDLAGSVSIAVHRTRPSRVFAVRAYPERSGDKILKILQKVQHPNVISTKDIYKHGEVLYSVGVDRPLTLDNLVACDRFPSELQLASILAQVLNGISYLLANGWEHQAIEYSNILLGLDGLIEIAALEHCVEHQLDQSQSRSLSALTTVTTLLMQKYVKADGAIGIDNVDCWSIGSEPVEFLSATTSVVTIEDLKLHPFIAKSRWSPGELIGLVRLALISTHTFITSP